MSKSKAPNPVGSPSKYHKRFCKPARALCERGATDKELAEYFEVNVSTIGDWKRSRPEFATATKEGKIVADKQVEKALYERAVGYSHPDTHFSAFNGEVTETPTVKHYAPSEVACIFWLKNRKPKEWRDKHDVVHENPDGSSLIPQSIIEAAAAIAKKL